jgi:hypothetical protein
MIAAYLAGLGSGFVAGLAIGALGALLFIGAAIFALGSGEKRAARDTDDNARRLDWCQKLRTWK